MAIVVPVPIPESPPVPQRSDPSTFAQRADDYVSWQTDEMAPGIDAQAEATYQNALHAQDRANAASVSASQAASSASASAQSATDAQAAEESAWLAAAASGSELTPDFRNSPGDIVIINGEGTAMETAPYPSQNEVGDIVFTARELGAPEFLPADGARYVRSDQTSLASVIDNEPAPPFTRITGNGIDNITDASVVAFSADGRLLAIAGINNVGSGYLNVILRDGDSYVSVGGLLISPSSRTPVSIAFSSDNKNIAVGFDDGVPQGQVELFVANVSESGALAAAPGFPVLLAGSPLTTISAFVGVSFSSADHRLAVSVGVNGGGGYLMTWVRSGTTYVIEHSSVPFTSGFPQRELGFSHDGKCLAVCKTGGAGGPVEIFDMSGAVPVALDVVSTVPENLSGYGLAWAPDGTLFVGRNYFPTIIAFVRSENRFRQADDVVDAYDKPVARLGISRDGRFMAVSHWAGNTPEIVVNDLSFMRIRGVTATEIVPPANPSLVSAGLSVSFGQGAGRFMDSVMVITAGARVGVYRDGYDYDPYTQIVVPDYRDVQRSPTRAYIKARSEHDFPKARIFKTITGQDSHVVVIPKFRMEDIDSSLGEGVHPAFIVDGVEKDRLYVGAYPGVVQNGELISLPGVDPAYSRNHDSFLAAARACGNGWHMMTNAEWAAVALWCWKNGLMPRGNTYYGISSDAALESGIRSDGGTPGDPTGNARTLTGSGPDAWRHDGTADGIADLCGNVWEWSAGIRVVAGEIQIIPDNNAAIHTTDLGPTSAAWRAIDGETGALVVPTFTGTIAGGDYAPTTPNSVRYAVSGTANHTLVRASGATFQGMTNQGATPVSAAALAVVKRYGLYPAGPSLGGDGFWLGLVGERLAFRGGNWHNGALAGVFSLYVSYVRGGTFTNIGARPAFVL